MKRTFTPFQVWLETQVANGRTLASVAKDFDMKQPQLTRLRTGENSFPLTRIARGMELTGLTLQELTVKASAEWKAEPIGAVQAPGAPMAPEPIVIVFEPTTERVRLCLEHGLKFGTERALFCDSQPQGDLDEAWAIWLAQREAAHPTPEPDEVPKLPPQPALYDHLKRDVQRPDHGRNPALVTGGDNKSNFTILVGGSDDK